MNSVVILGLYVAPAVVLFGFTFVVLRISKTALILPFEYGTWLLPGIIYWIIPVLIYEARWYGVDMQPPKSLVNLGEPVLVAVLYWLIFIARLIAARKQPQINQRAAYWCAGAGIAISVAMPFVMPLLPE
jgi:hypothetical protein